MAGDNRDGFERLGDVKGGEPLVDTRDATGFRQIEVHAVVDDVAGHQQTDLGRMQHRRRVGIGVTHFNRQQASTLELETMVHRRR